MRTLRKLGLLVAIVAGMILVLKLGRSLATGSPKVRTGPQKKYEDIKKGSDGHDPQEELRESLRSGA